MASICKHAYIVILFFYFNKLSKVFRLCVISSAVFQWLSRIVSGKVKQTKIRKTTLNHSGRTFHWMPRLAASSWLLCFVFSKFLFLLFFSLIRYNTAFSPFFQLIYFNYVIIIPLSMSMLCDAQIYLWPFSLHSITYTNMGKNEFISWEWTSWNCYKWYLLHQWFSNCGLRPLEALDDPFTGFT